MAKSGKKSMAKAALVFAGALVLLFVLFILAIVGFATDTVSRLVLYKEKKPATADYVTVLARVILVDLNKKEMEVRLSFSPEGALRDEAHLLKQPVTVFVSPSTSSKSRVYEVGDFMSPIDVTVDTFGEVALYPWDKHTADVEILMLRPVTGGPSVGVPVRVIVEGSVSGVDLSVKVKKAADGADALIAFEAKRSPVTKVVVWFSIFMLWVLAGTVVVMAFLVARGSKLEMVMFPFAGTLLFSMIAFRNAMPGAPPIGCLSDYLGFFWGYVLVAASLVTLTVVWVRRRDRNG